jgi:putative FmdB family regulatory protein
MPLYEYQCDACGHRFEAIRKFSDEPLEVCPKCGGHIQKLISAPAFAFKGTGWYVTDYAKKDSVAAGKSDGAGSKDKDSQSKDSTDSKDSGEKDSKSSSDTSAKESSSTPAKAETSTKSESSSTTDKSA